jgi:hypothetical protein
MSETVFTIFMSLKTQAAWLALSRRARQDFLGETVRPILARYPRVALRYYDAEAFTGVCTDMAVFETADLRAYQFLVDALRDTPFLGLPYFAVVDIVVAVEDGYRAYNREQGVGEG